MPMLRKALFLLIFTAVAHLVAAQYVRLTPATASSALYFDSYRLVNYNRYDGWHFDVALHYAYPNDNSERGRHSRFQWQCKAFAGYGVKTKAMSYGGEAALIDRHTRRWRYSIAYSHHLEQAGATTLDDYNMFNFAENSVYRADRFSLADRITVASAANASDNLRLQASLSYSLERRLFDNYGILLYDDAINTPLLRYGSAILRATYLQRLSLTARTTMRFDHSTAPFAMLLAQYKHRTPIAEGLRCRLFLQGGATTPNTPYPYLFDISGTAATHSRIGYFFHNTMLTVAPNEFHAHLFARGIVTLELAQPIYNFAFSSPIPFVQLGMMGGWLIDDNHISDSSLVDGIAVQTPSQGIAEPAIGINRLLRWRLLEGGVAVAYRLTPHNAPYHHNDTKDNLSLMVSLQLGI